MRRRTGQQPNSTHGGATRSSTTRRARLVGWRAVTSSFALSAMTMSTMGALVSTPARAQAKPVKSDEARLEEDLKRVGSEVDRLLAEYPEVPDVAGGAKIDEWLSLGQIALLSGNNADAALLFYGAVAGPVGNDGLSKTHPAYAEAVNGLAEALFNLGNYATANYYYEELLQGGNHQFQENALLRLIEIASRLSDDDSIKRYYKIYQQNPRGQTPSEVLYALGRSYFLSKKDDDAKDALVQIQSGDRYYLRAHYLIGAIETRAGRLAEALKVYDALAFDAPAIAPEDNTVKELAFLARGRLYYEQGLLTEAVDAYQYIQIDSDYLSTMLYEVIWTYVRRGSDALRDEKVKPRDRRKQADAEYDLALERLRYLRYLEAGSDLEPDIAILMGNLQIQRGDFDEAELAFHEVLSTYAPADDEMRRMIADPEKRKRLLQDILALESGGLSVDTSLPPVAARRAKENPEVAEALRMFKEIEQSKAEIAATRKVLGKLDSAINEGDRTELFREVAGPYSRAKNNEAGLLKIEGQVVELKRARAMAKASPTEKLELEKLAAETRALDGKMAQVASTDEGLKARKKRYEERLGLVEGAASRIRIELKGMRNQVMATDQMLGVMKKASSESPLEIENLRKELSFFNKQLEAFEADEAKLVEEAKKIRTALKVSGGRGKDDDAIQSAYSGAVSRESELLDRILGADAAQYASLLQRTRAQKLRNGTFKTKIDDVVTRRVADMKSVLAAERDNLAEYERRTDAVGRQAEVYRDRATKVALDHVRDVLDQIVVRADIGVIDVAWQRKQQQTNKIGELQRAKAAELTDLNQAYADLTKDEAQ